MASTSDAPAMRPDIGGGMAGFDFGRGQRTLVFLHANGFNAGTYLPMLAPLAKSARVVVPDLRGHGQTALAAEPRGRRNWSDMRDDVLRLLADLNAGPATVAGHSMGGTVALLAAARAPERVRNLVLLDPVILPRPAAAAMRLPLVGLAARRHPWVAATLKRRRRFAGEAEAIRAYQGRGAFRDWPAETLEAYVRHGFQPTADGGVELRADPAWESSGYGAQANDTWGALKRVGRPIAIWKGEHGSTCAVAEQHVRRRKDLTVRTVSGGTHFFPMVMPDTARAALAEALG
ncbi:alpha/beta hydrolase [Brevundimonas sp.]|uniref:alpha/beta fold hydrolase n=1 Tax=Brevundimonas sp. TaxID=1871086 RepID=UPI0025FA52EC|nr:alpha/beta hydrolase [Brevundimonas sp.]